jgi:uncharacterized damage-inducible protein DinB
LAWLAARRSLATTGVAPRTPLHARALPARYTQAMAIKDGILPEFDHEMGTTRRLLERVPEADFAWTPHEKSFPLGHLAAHIANIPNWVGITMDTAELDAAALGEDARPKPPASRADLLARFDASVSAARARIDEQTDPAFFAPWTLKNGSLVMFTMPKLSVLRTFVINHLIHHRGQLTVYLRLRNVPLPSIYGPTADES